MENEQQVPPTPFLAIAIILSSYYLFIFLLLAMVSQETFEQLSPQENRYLIILSEISFIVIPLVYLRYKGYSLTEYFRLRQPPMQVLVMALPLGMGMTFLMEELLRILNLVFPPPSEAIEGAITILQYTTGPEFLLIIVGLIIIAPLVEEFIFRGFLHHCLEYHSGATMAILYGSIGWAVLHITPYYFAQTVPLFLYGFILGYLSYKTGSIWPSVLCHAINNGIAVLSVNTGFEDKLPFFTAGDHLSPFVIALALVMVVGSIRYLERFYGNDGGSSSASTPEEKR